MTILLNSISIAGTFLLLIGIHYFVLSRLWNLFKISSLFHERGVLSRDPILIAFSAISIFVLNLTGILTFVRPW